MIEFKGEISNECKKFLQKKFTQGLRLGLLISIIIFSTLITIIALFYEKIIFLFLLVQIPLFILLYPFPNSVPVRIEIGEDYLAVECKNKDGKKDGSVRDIVDVKQVIDMGDWYYITFYFPHKTIDFACQKDLITQGTLEEFEALFEDRLIRQTDN